MGEPPGDSTVYPLGLPDAVITADVIKLTPGPDILPSYLSMAIGSQYVRRQILSITSGVAQRKVSLARFRDNIKIPLPPLQEQHVIVGSVERWHSAIGLVERSLGVESVHINALRSSICAAAFSGNLTAQDSTDEPASILLDRIAAERSSLNIRRRRHNPRNAHETTAT
jgi:type I restriction enzyme S subunit